MQKKIQSPAQKNEKHTKLLAKRNKQNPSQEEDTCKRKNKRKTLQKQTNTKHLATKNQKTIATKSLWQKKKHKNSYTNKHKIR